MASSESEEPGLILSRQKGEEVYILDEGGRRVVVEVFEIRGDKVRLRVKAPREYTVNRRELWEAIQNESLGHQVELPKDTIRAVSYVQQGVMASMLIERTGDKYERICVNLLTGQIKYTPLEATEFIGALAGIAAKQNEYARAGTTPSGLVGLTEKK